MSIEDAQSAREDVLEEGQLWTFIQLDRTKADSTKPWRNTPDARAALNDSQDVPAVRIPPSGVSRLGLTNQQVDRLKRSEAILIVAPGYPFTPLLEQFDATIDPQTGVEYKLETVEILQPADVRILYYFGIRR